ncbi:MAG: hypothetical protein AMJ76_03785 [Dehalococcoidia bacterium SM23_28_1]|nr:MAG: hypothetical protein AMJ76_03785 [Dehalococcoidia bacterium SM23_28_1]
MFSGRLTGSQILACPLPAIRRSSGELYPDITSVNAGWIDDAMSVLDSPDADEAWGALIRRFVERVWVERDGGITVEGVVDVNPLANPGTDVGGTDVSLSNPPS